MSKRAGRTRSERAGSGGLLERILAAPNLARVVPQLPADALHRVIQHCGLEDSGELVALATPEQLARVFDLDLWRPPAPGLDERFDAGRFGTWLEVMVEAGAASAAAALAAMDVDLVAAGFVQHVRVFDHAAAEPYTTLDGEVAAAGLAAGDRLRFEVGGYVVMAARATFWDAITAVLVALADGHSSSFDQVMVACRRLSSSRPEIDGLDGPLTTNDQAMFDLALDREARRGEQGYVTPAQARAFLQASRQLDLRRGAMPDRVTATPAHVERADRADAADDVPVEAVAAFVDLLHEAGVMPRTPQLLLESPEPSTARLARIRTQLQFVGDRDFEASAARSAELAYLSNVIVAGSTIQERPVTAEEASSAALAVCNLGLENWPAHWRAGMELPEDFLIHRDLVTVFQVGWTVLHEEVCMSAADQLLGLLTSLHCADSDIQTSLDALQRVLTKWWRAGSPWKARHSFDVIAILDAPSWAALLGLIDQFPTLHAAVGASLSATTRQVDPLAFEFIAENAQIQRIHEFMQGLPGRLGG